MPATPTYALPYPAQSDPADVPLDMQELAERIELVFPGKEFAYAELTAPVTITATAIGSAQTIVTAPAVTFVAAPILVEFFTPECRPAGAAGNTLSIYLFQDGAAFGRIAIISTPSAGNFIMAQHLYKRFTPTAGSHTYSIRAIVSATGGNVEGGSGVGTADTPAFIRITRA